MGDYSLEVDASETTVLGRTAAVVRAGGHVGDGADLEADTTERPDRRLAARARTLDVDVDLLHAVFHGLTTGGLGGHAGGVRRRLAGDRKSTRLNSSHVKISYAVFCL